MAASVAIFAAAVPHSVAHGQPAPLLGVVLALAFAMPLCVLLAGKALSWFRLSVAVGLSQFVLHGMLMIGVGESSGGAAFVSGAGGHAHGQITVLTTSAAAAQTTQTAQTTHSDPAMWLAHVFAAIVTILAIGHGERAIRMLLELTGWSLVTRLLSWSAPRIAVRLRVVLGRVFVASSVHLTCAVSRRGPPVTA
ncbi:hypothetical protein L2X99_15100 [Microbacterium sp. KUDC0406]|uniref:hypothetical protein n=1 Tax=Microbacterium sp. KUDC0406 TaxID=2909588 RepID=UPI001F29252C|nr:hypothetical protein [Microbacterium sp. KUDC0406]UJP09711.1 hypothetical protein L2X99_15100 [Microbacterium sp. KUDC0406]